MASGVGSVAVAVASGVVDGVGSGPASGDVDAEFESLESSEESTSWVELVPEAHPAAITIATHTNERRDLLPMTNANVHGDLNFFYLCVV